MYDEQVPALKAHALASPDGLLDVITFTLLTIQQPFARMRDQFVDVRKNGAKSRFLFGSKRAGYRYARKHKATLFAAITRAAHDNDAQAAVAALVEVPGLGIPKASFVAQMVGLQTACLDRHNLRALDMPETALRSINHMKPDAKRRKIAEYTALCMRHGDARKWWNQWCAFIAARGGANKRLLTGDAVSRFHTEAIGIQRINAGFGY